MSRALRTLTEGFRAWREDRREKRPERGRRAASAISTAVLVLAVAFCAYVLLQVQVFGYVRLFGYSMFRVVTGSMEPTIPTGALLISHETDVGEIEPGDIVCFRSQDPDTNGWIITHRVTSVQNDGRGDVRLETKGDANTAADIRYVTGQNLIGKVVWFTGEGNALATVVAFLTSGTGFLSVILFPCLLIAGMLLGRSVRTIRGELKLLSEEGDRLAEKNRTSAEAAAYGLTPEEYETMVREVMQELLAMKDEIMEMVRQELYKQMQQGEYNEYAAIQEQNAPEAGASRGGGGGTTE